MRRAFGSRARERGVALVLVLWSFMTLGVLALDFSRHMREDAKAGMNFAEETQAYYAARAGMQKALYEATERMTGVGTPSASSGSGPDEEEDPVQAESGSFHGYAYSVEVRPECGRIPINRIARRASSTGQAGPTANTHQSREFLKRLVTNLLVGGNAAVEGVDRREAAQIEEVVDSIIDWVDTNRKPEPNGAEVPWYVSNRGYRPFPPASLYSPDYLLLVRGVTPDLFYGKDGRPGLRDVVTVWCGNGQDEEDPVKIDARQVNLKVLQALIPDIGQDELARLQELRDSGDKLGFVETLKARLSADPVLAEQFDFDGLERTAVAVTAVADSSKTRNRSMIAGVFSLSNDVPEEIIWYDRAPFTGPMPRSQMAEGGE